MFSSPFHGTGLVFRPSTVTSLRHIFRFTALCLSVLLASACDARKLDKGLDESNETRRAREALSANLNQPVNSFTVVSVNAVSWPDASLGCPQPGMSYMQVVLDGHRVVLSDKQQEYHVHLGPRQAIVCPPNNIPPPDGILPTPER